MKCWGERGGEGKLGDKGWVGDSGLREGDVVFRCRGEGRWGGFIWGGTAGEGEVVRPLEGIVVRVLVVLPASEAGLAGDPR